MNALQPEPATSFNSKVPVAVAKVIDNTSEGVSSAASNVSDSIANASTYMEDSVSSFGDADVVGSSTDFLNSNTLVAKFC